MTTATVQGWTLSLTDTNGNVILDNVETSSISVTYDNIFDNRVMEPFGDLTAVMTIPLDQIDRWTASFSEEVGWSYANIRINSNNNVVNAVYNNAILTSVSWWDFRTETTVNWKFSGRNVVATPPRELSNQFFKRKKQVEQKLDWLLYGF